VSNDSVQLKNGITSMKQDDERHHRHHALLSLISPKLSGLPRRLSNRLLV
jgi:hypothetical protein